MAKCTDEKDFRLLVDTVVDKVIWLGPMGVPEFDM